jgi:hypothetical protein
MDNVYWCSYDPSNPTDVSNSRYNLSLMLPGMSAAYETNDSASFAAFVDSSVGAAFGKLGGPGADSQYILNFDTDVASNWFKDFGLFFGIGEAYTWPAARTGTLTSKLQGR